MTAIPLKKMLKPFPIFLFVTYLINLATILVFNIPSEFEHLGKMAFSFVNEGWKASLFILMTILFIILYINLFWIKWKKVQTLPKYLIVGGGIIFYIVLSLIFWNFTIAIVPTTGRLTTDRVNNIYVDYQTKYSIQQIQLATVILSLPSLYAIIMIILTNYYWQKPVKD